MKKDSTLLGLLVGLIAPLLVMLAFWKINFWTLTIIGFSDLMLQSGNLPGLISIGLLGNLLAFGFFYRKELDVTVRGVIGATFLYGLLIIILKFFVL